MYHENVVYLIGNIGRKDDARYLPDGTKAVTISVATDEHFTSRNGEKQKRTNWHRCVAFGKIADILDEYTAKGSYIRLTGKLQTREYERPGWEKAIHYRGKSILCRLARS